MITVFCVQQHFFKKLVLSRKGNVQEIAKKKHFPSFPKKITCIFVTSAAIRTKPEMCILFRHDDTPY